MKRRSLLLTRVFSEAPGPGGAPGGAAAGQRHASPAACPPPPLPPPTLPGALAPSETPGASSSSPSSARSPTSPRRSPPAGASMGFSRSWGGAGGHGQQPPSWGCWWGWGRPWGSPCPAPGTHQAADDAPEGARPLLDGGVSVRLQQELAPRHRAELPGGGQDGGTGTPTGATGVPCSPPLMGAPGVPLTRGVSQHPGAAYEGLPPRSGPPPRAVGFPPLRGLRSGGSL